MNRLNYLKQIKDFAESKHYTIGTCESLTSGLLAGAFGSCPGISSVYKGGYVTYQTEQKINLVQVSKETLKKYGAISAQTAEEMCNGTQKNLKSEIVVSTTGNAGPDPMEQKPVGEVYIGVKIATQIHVKEFHFSGSRDEIRNQTVDSAIECLFELIHNA